MPDDKIRIEKIRAYGYHGVFPHEKSQGQNFYVSLTLSLDLQAAGKSDDLEQTVNYAAVVARVVEIVSARPGFNLIEALAEKIAASLLCEFPRVDALEVEIHKPEAPIPTPFGDVIVSVSRTRESL